MNRLAILRVIQLLIDALTAGVALVIAYQLTLVGTNPPRSALQLAGLALFFAALRVAVNSAARVYRLQWRYVTLGDALQIARVYLATSLVLLVVQLAIPGTLATLRVPVAVIVIELALSFGGALSARILRRLLYERERAAGEAHEGCRLLLVGAGHHGVAVAKEMAGRKGTTIVGFVDDDPRKAGSVICGVPVLGPISALADIRASHNVDEVLICIPPAARRALNLDGQSTGVPIRSKIVPTIDEILSAAPPPAVQPVSKPSNGWHIAVPEIPRLEIPVVKGKTVLITGGAGFIGSNLAERLADHNQVILFDLDFDGKPVDFTSLRTHPNVRLVQGSLLDNPSIKALAADANIVVHAAAIVGVSRVCNASRKTLETNYDGTARLLEALEHSGQLERFIYFSTSEVFGVNSFRVSEDTPPSIGPIAEARWSYAIAKLAGEHLVKSYHREIGLPIAIVRPFNVFGPKRTGDHALLRFILNSLNGRPIEVHGDGSQIRSWCYIDDFCTALLEMMVRPQAVGEDFNIGNPANTLTIHALACKVLELTKTDVPIIFHPNPFPDIEIRVPALTKARKCLGYEPRYDLDTALRLTIGWYQQHRETVSALSAFAQAEQKVLHPGAARVQSKGLERAVSA